MPIDGLRGPRNRAFGRLSAETGAWLPRRSFTALLRLQVDLSTAKRKYVVILRDPRDSAISNAHYVAGRTSDPNEVPAAPTPAAPHTHTKTHLRDPFLHDRYIYWQLVSNRSRMLCWLAGPRSTS